MLKGNPDTDKRLLWHHIASIMLKIAHDEVLVPVHDSPNLVPFAAGVIAEKDYYDFFMEDVQVDIDIDLILLKEISAQDKIKANLSHDRALPILPGIKE